MVLLGGAASAMRAVAQDQGPCEAKSDCSASASSLSEGLTAELVGRCSSRNCRLVCVAPARCSASSQRLHATHHGYNNPDCCQTCNHALTSKHAASACRSSCKERAASLNHQVQKKVPPREKGTSIQPRGRSAREAAKARAATGSGQGGGTRGRGDTRGEGGGATGGGDARGQRQARKVPRGQRARAGQPGVYLRDWSRRHGPD